MGSGNGTEAAGHWATPTEAAWRRTARGALGFEGSWLSGSWGLGFGVHCRSKGSFKALPLKRAVQGCFKGSSTGSGLGLKALRFQAWGLG